MEELLTEWESFAQKLLTPAKTLSRAALRDDAESLLRAVALDMETAQSPAQQALKSKGGSRPGARSIELLSSTHAHDRYGIGFDVNQLIAEYRAVRASVIRLWTQRISQADQSALEELIRFNEAIDEILADSVALYSSIVERAKDLFLAVLGHDLRSPLNAVLASASALLLSENTSNQAMKSAALILRSTSRMGQMVSDLVDFTRTRLGDGVPILRLPMDLGGAIQEVIEEIGAAYPQHTIRFAKSGDLHGSWDEARMKQVLTNLIENSVQHGTRETPVTVNVYGDGERVIFTVNNYGPPIPESDRARIFEPLVGAKETSSPIISSHMGLGLYIVRQIVQGHGGKIDVTSTQSGGTTFAVNLPRR